MKKRNRVLAAVATLGLALGLSVAAAAPAQAYTIEYTHRCPYGKTAKLYLDANTFATQNVKVYSTATGNLVGNNTYYRDSWSVGSGVQSARFVAYIPNPNYYVNWYAYC